MSLLEREPWSRIPARRTRPAGLMTLNTVHREIRAGTIFEAVGAIGRGREARERLRSIDRRVEVTSKREERELVAAETVHVRRLVQLASVPAQHMATGIRVARETGRARRNLPLLLDGIRAVLDRH